MDSIDQFVADAILGRLRQSASSAFGQLSRFDTAELRSAPATAR